MTTHFSKLRVPARMLLAALTLFASIGVMASPASAAPPSSNGGTDPTTPEDTAVSGTVVYTSTDGQPIYLTGGGGSGPANLPSGATLATTVTGSGTTTVTINYTYTPPANYSGTDSFDFYVSDVNDAGTIETETVIITAVDDPITSNGGTDPSTAYGTPVDGSIVFNDPDNAIDRYGYNTTTARGGSLAILSNPGFGTNTLTLNYRYTPPTGYSGTDSVMFSAGTVNASVTETETFTVAAAPNTAPVANDFSVTTNEDTPIGILFAGQTSDAEGNTLTYTALSAPANGSLTTVAGGFTYTPNANYNGTDTFNYRACDPSGLCDDGTVTVTVNAVNDAPVTVGTNPTTAEDTSVTGTVQATDDGDGTIMISIGAPSNGTYVSNSYNPTTDTFSYEYLPNSNFNGTDTIQLTFTDGDGAETVHTETVTVTAANDAPTANNATFNGNQDGTVTGTVTGSDVEGSTLTYNVATPPTDGTITAFDTATGAFTYTPNTGYYGTDSFTFTVNDGTATSSSATVTLVLNGAPIADNTDATLTEDGSVDLALGDYTSDPDNGDADLTFSVTADAGHGTASVVGSTLTYTPDENWNGADTVTYQACDPNNLCDTGIVTFTVTAVNDAPVTANDAYNATEDTTLPGDSTRNVLTNDTDVDNNTMTAVLVYGATNGTVTLNSDGTFTYVPNLNFNGTDTFTYAAYDGDLFSNTATVTITVAAVNDAPLANSDDDYTTAEDTVLESDALRNVLTNDFDQEGTALTAELVTGAQNGTVVLNSDGTFTYTPAANFNGVDEFVYRAFDGELYSQDMLATITVSAANDTPVLTDFVSGVNEDELFTFPLSAVGSDVDSDVITYTVETAPSNGTLTINNDAGTFTYLSALNYNGSDSFAIRGCDPDNACDISTNNMTVHPVNDAPVLPGGSYTIDEDQTVNGTVAWTDVDDTELAFTTTIEPTNGALTLNGATGEVSYTPVDNFNGTDTFSVEGCDANGLCDIAVVNITVTAINDGPVTSDNAITVTEDTAYSGTVGVSDADDTTFTFAVNTEPTNGTVTVDAATGEYVYTPTANYVGADSFTITACDAGPLCSTATVTVNVVAVNDNPVAADATITTNEDSSATGTVTVEDVDDTTFTFTVATAPAHGTVTVDAATGVYTYTPSSNFNGADTFTIEACDTTGLCDTATINVTVGSVNDGPSASATDVETDEDIPVSGTISVSDNDDSTFGYEVTVVPENGTVTVDADGTFTYTPDADWNGTDLFTVEVCDNGGACDTVTIGVTVNPVNDAPIAPADENFAGEDQAATVGDAITLDGSTVEDADGDTLTYTWAQVSGPTVTLSDTGSMNPTFTPTEVGAYVFMFTACDADGECVSDMVTVEVFAAAVTPPTPVTPDPVTPVTPVTPVNPVVVTPPAAAPTATTNNRGPLAETGTNTITFAGIGFMLVLAGGMVLLLGRRQKETE